MAVLLPRVVKAEEMEGASVLSKTAKIAIHEVTNFLFQNLFMGGIIA
jgi:hypothetical protein